ncbi:MAG: DUF4105 domain-containing protein [Nitrospirota bacterium]
MIYIKNGDVPITTGLQSSTVCSLFFFIALFLWVASAHASPVTEILNEAEQRRLAVHPTWLKLLHYDQEKNQSVVLTDTFFLSPEGGHDPYAELTATLMAYFSPWDQDAMNHPRCRFPARYFWLSKQLTLPNYTLRDDHCQRLKEWALFDHVTSVSFLLVSGYLGNPASTFGHALLKLNTDVPDDPLGFFDLTINYGALIPEHENPLRYIVRGLSGGYEAGFSDRYFYTQDLVYTRTEFRDMWEYRLALSDQEQTLLILYIWEIVGKKFTYYFLDKNCAYRLAELLNMVIDEEVVGEAHGWYLPVEFFHRLQDIDRTRRKATGNPLIQSIRLIPSSQRKLFYQLQLLTMAERKAFNAIVREAGSTMLQHLQPLTPERKSLLLDSLLAYQQYRLIAEKGEPDLSVRAIKDQILLARLQLPASPVVEAEIPAILSPAEGSKPMAIGASLAIGNDGDSFLRLTGSPFKQERIGQNRFEGNELVVLDIAVGVFEEDQKIFLDHLDMIRIFNTNRLSIPIAGENQFSWDLRAGVSRVENNGADGYDGLVSFGVGYGWAPRQRPIAGYAMVDLAAHTLDPLVRLRPHVALQADIGQLRVWAYTGAESAGYNGDFNSIWGGKFQYLINSRYALQIELTNERFTRASVGINWYR